MLSDWFSRVFTSTDPKLSAEKSDRNSEEISVGNPHANGISQSKNENFIVPVEGTLAIGSNLDRVNEENILKFNAMNIHSPKFTAKVDSPTNQPDFEHPVKVIHSGGYSRSSNILPYSKAVSESKVSGLQQSQSMSMRTSLLSSRKNFFSSFFSKTDLNAKTEMTAKVESNMKTELNVKFQSSEVDEPINKAESAHDSEDSEEINIFTDPSHAEENSKPVLDDFSMIRVLGKGSYGKVVLVRKKSTQVLYAMKVLKKIDVVRKRQVERTKIERRVLGYVDHPFLMKLHFAFQTGNKLYFVLDYCPGGELFFHLSRYKRFPEGVVRFYTAELVLALKHLHDHNVIYRDIKPENILLDAEGHIKLGDFGLAKDNITEAAFGAFSVCGTPEYMAPEVINKDGHGTSVDWWGLGMLMYEMLTGLPPWYTKDRQKLFERLRGAPLVFPKTISPISISIISGFLTRNPLKRLGANGGQEVMDHDFFYGLDWDGLLSKRIPAPLNPFRNYSTDSESTHNFDPQFTRLPIDTMNQVDGSQTSNLGNELNFDGFTYNDPCALYVADANAMRA